MFPQVFKLIGPEFANQNNTKIKGSSISRSRLICKHWNKVVDHFIVDGTPDPDFLNALPPQQPSDHALVDTRYQYFGSRKPTKLPEFLAHFETSHLPHFARNPFTGKVVFIDLLGFTDHTQWVLIADQVSSLLRKYGHNIQILNLGLFKYHADSNIQSQNHSWLLEWLDYCPNLSHLKVSGRFNLNDDLDVAFGIRPKFERVRTRRRIDLAMDFQVEEGYNGTREMAWQMQVNNKIEDLQRRSAEQRIVIEQLRAEMNAHRVKVDPLYVQPGVRAELLVPAAPPIVGNPVSMTTLKNLRCLKLSQLSARNFNSIISANTHVAWLSIEPLNVEKEKYIDYLALEFPNLTKLYLKLCSPEDFKKLKNIHQSWLSLTHLHFEYCMTEMCGSGHDFIEWVEIFKLISKNWGNTLTDLMLRLPTPKTEEAKATVARDSEIYRLDLSNLKRLTIWLSDASGVRVAQTDFLDLLRVNLEELIIK